MAPTKFPALNVLLVEDENFMRQLVGRILQEIGIKETVAVENGQQGLEMLQKKDNKFDLVICDLEMPVLSGPEFIRALRTLPEECNPHVPVIILTGHGRQDRVLEAVDLGIHDFLVKPVSRHLLESRIRRVLSAPMIDPQRLQVP